MDQKHFSEIDPMHSKHLLLLVLVGLLVYACILTSQVYAEATQTDKTKTTTASQSGSTPGNGQSPPKMDNGPHAKPKLTIQPIQPIQNRAAIQPRQ